MDALHFLRFQYTDNMPNMAIAKYLNYTSSMYRELFIPDEAETVARIFHKANRQCWLVGGAVRDALLGRITVDFDLATDAPPREIQKLFRRTIPTGIKHGTVTILMGKHSFETTTFRSESTYSDGRHPDTIVWSKDIQDDLSRRDFTINAIAWDILNRKLFDPFNAVQDLQNKCIRAIGNPDTRFNEDALRVLRACRLSAQLNFNVEPDTLAAIRPVLPHVKKLSAERIWEELKKIFTTATPSTAFRLFQETGLMELLMPEMNTLLNNCDEFHKVLRACDLAPNTNFPVRAAALFHKMKEQREKAAPLRPDEEALKKLLKRFKASGKEMQRISRLVHNAAFPDIHDQDDAIIRYYMVETGVDLLEDLFALQAAIMKANEPETIAQFQNLEKLQQRVSQILQRGDPLTIHDLAIDGKTLMRELALQPSPTLGKLLNKLLKTVLDNPKLNFRDTLLDIARQILTAGTARES